MEEGNGNIKSIMMMVASTIGVGMYFTPHSFAQMGIENGQLILQGVVSLTIIASLCIFFSAKLLESDRSVELQTFGENESNINVSENKEEESFIEDAVEVDIEGNRRYKKLSFAKLGYKIYPFIRIVIEFMLVISCLATCMFYLKYITGNAVNLINLPHDNPMSNYMQYIIIFMVSAVLFCIAQVRDLSKVGWMGYVNVALILTVGLCVFILKMLLPGFRGYNCQTTGGDFFYAIVNFIFAMSGLHNSVEIYNGFREKNKKSILLNSIIPPIVCGILYSFVGLVGMSLFGSKMPAIDIISILSDSNSDIRIYIAQNFPAIIFLPYCMSIMVMLALCIGFVFQMSAVTRSLLKNPYICAKTKKAKHRINTIVCFAIIVGVNLIPNLELGVLFTLISDYLCLPLSFIFPFIFSYYYLGKKRFIVKFFSFISICTSLVFIGADTYVSFFSGKGDNTECITESLENSIKNLTLNN